MTDHGNNATKLVQVKLGCFEAKQIEATFKIENANSRVNYIKPSGYLYGL